MSESSKNDFPGMSRFCAIVSDFMVKKLPFKLKNILCFFYPMFAPQEWDPQVCFLHMDCFCDIPFIYLYVILYHIWKTFSLKPPHKASHLLV